MLWYWEQSAFLVKFQNSANWDHESWGWRRWNNTRKPSYGKNCKLRNSKNRKGIGLGVCKFLGPFPKIFCCSLQISFSPKFLRRSWRFEQYWSILLNRISSNLFQSMRTTKRLAEQQVHGSSKRTTEASTNLGDRNWWRLILFGEVGVRLWNGGESSNVWTRAAAWSWSEVRENQSHKRRRKVLRTV